MGMPPTGKRISVTGIDIFRFEGGKIVEHWNQSDMLGLLQQLGAIPSPAQTS
jgi:predicted ester cyclase